MDFVEACTNGKVFGDGDNVTMQQIEFHRYRGFRMACAKGHIKTVSYLLTFNIPKYVIWRGLIKAIQFDHIGVVHCLLNDSRCDPSLCNNHAIKMAVSRGQVATCSALLNQHGVGPNVRNGELYDIAIRKNDIYIFVILLSDKSSTPGKYLPKLLETISKFDSTTGNRYLRMLMQHKDAQQHLTYEQFWSHNIAIMGIHNILYFPPPLVWGLILFRIMFKSS